LKITLELTASQALDLRIACTTQAIEYGKQGADGGRALMIALYELIRDAEDKAGTLVTHNRGAYPKHVPDDRIEEWTP
jgi:hypothetical protein